MTVEKKRFYVTSVFLKSEKRIIDRVTVTPVRFISMPAGFRRHVVGQTLRNVCNCVVA